MDEFSHASCNIWCMCACSVMSNSVTPWTVAHQAPLSIEFSNQEYWNVFPFLRPGDLPNPGIKPAASMSPALAGGFFTTEPPGKPSTTVLLENNLYVDPCSSNLCCSGVNCIIILYIILMTCKNNKIHVC